MNILLFTGQFKNYKFSDMRDLIILTDDKGMWIFFLFTMYKKKQKLRVNGTLMFFMSTQLIKKVLEFENGCFCLNEKW